MKAWVYSKYGSPDHLELLEVKKPVPKPHEVLLKIKAVSINSWDWDLLRGKPFIVRLAGGGLSKPRKPVLGCDVAGQIEAIGRDVTGYAPGDAVYGDLSACGWGGFAEYVCAPVEALIRKPIAMSFQQAAAIPQAGVMALQGVRDYGNVQEGQKVLINGAGGGVGSFAISLAKLHRAQVTAVDHKGKFEMMSALGADYLIDYTEEDFTRKEERYDLILDSVGHHSLYDFKRALKPGGNYRMIGGSLGLIFQAVFVAPFISMFGNKKMGILAHEPNKGLDHLNALFEAGSLKPVIDRQFAFDKVPEAFRYFGENQFSGKVIVTV